MRKRPTGFTLLALVLGVGLIAGFPAFLAYPPTPGDPYGLLQRASLAAALLLSALLALALWRCERWVGRAAVVWFAVLYLAAVVHTGDAFPDLQESLTWLSALLMMVFPFFVLAYVLERAARLRIPAVTLPRGTSRPVRRPVP
jgi:hypothetical protein